MLLALAAIWGSSFMFIKVAVRELEPGVVVFGRVFVATLTLLPAVSFMIGWRRLVTELRRFARPLVVLALFNASIPFWLLAWGEERLDSGLAAVLQASTPLFTALLAFGFSRSDRVGGARLIGVVVGFFGVVFLIGAQPQGDWLAALAVLLTAACYAASALYAGSRLAAAPPIVTSLGTLAVATLTTLPFGIAQLPDQVPSWKVIGSVVALGSLGLSVAYLLYFGLIASAGASYAVLVTYLVPAIALGYGAVFLDEQITASAIGGLAADSRGGRAGHRLASPAPPCARRAGAVISIRRARADDVDFLHGLVNDDDVEPFLGGRAALDRESLLREVERSDSEPQDFGRFVIEADGERVGAMGFEVANRRSQIARLERLAVQPVFRGRGIADEAARQFQRHVLLDLGYHRLELEIYAFNERALAHAERAGFVREGVKRKAYLRHGDRVDAVMFALLREDLAE